MDLTLVCENLNVDPGNGARLKVSLSEVEAEGLRRYLPALKEKLGASALTEQFTPYEYAGTLNATDRKALYEHLKSDFEE